MHDQCMRGPTTDRRLRTTRRGIKDISGVISEPDGSYHDNPLDRCRKRGQTGCMRVELPRRPRMPVTFLLSIALMVFWCARDKSFAQTGTSKTRATLIVFAERNMHDAEWSALFDALKRGARSESAAVPALAGAEFLRGDAIKGGIAVSQPISVYLHGTCSLVPMERTASLTALGWVWRVHGRIEPFIHVDCTQIAEELGPVVLGMDRNRRDTVMGEALARVILHEWIHVATQNPGHARDGVAKAQFDLVDLLAYDEEVRRNPRILRRPWDNM